jgi:signal transduction histidine kinase
MLQSLRLRLTFWFVIICLLLYTTGAFLGTFVLMSALTTALDDELHRLQPEIRPSIEIVDGRPTLKRWESRARNVNLKFLPTIQIYDLGGNLLETYGPPGVTVLKDGTLRNGSGDQSVAVRSGYRKIFLGPPVNGKIVGYFQIQVSTKHQDEVIRQFILTTLVFAPFGAVGLGLSGYFFSGKAVEPVGQTLQMLRRFTADAGHELNTPITLIEASLQTIEQMRLEKEDPTEVFDVISRASARMRDLAANLMTLARVESLEQGWPRVHLEVKDIVLPLIEEFTELAKRKNIELTCEQIQSLELVGHGDSISRMLSNLLSNAVRYTEPGGKIKVSVTAQEQEVAFVVEDSGIGIPAESIEHIFERFYRVDQSRSRAAGGSGLGLSIVKAIVDMHKGIIKVESAVGVGSKFTVLFPLANR